MAGWRDIAAVTVHVTVCAGFAADGGDRAGTPLGLPVRLGALESSRSQLVLHHRSRR